MYDPKSSISCKASVCNNYTHKTTKRNINDHSMSKCIFYVTEMFFTKDLNICEPANYASFKQKSALKLEYTIQSHQFPVRPVFAIILHTAQSPTFKFPGVALRISIFVHGMRQVIFSSGQRWNNLKVLLPTENPRQTGRVV